MELTRRFVFRGNASAFGGQFFRRDDDRLKKPVYLGDGATSSLTVVGGVSSDRSKSMRFLDGFVRVGNAATNASASFDDFTRAVAMSRSNTDVPEETLTTTTKVSAWVEDLVIGKDPKQLRGKQPEESRGKPRLSVGWVGGSLISSSGKPGDEPPIRLVGRETDIKGIEIDGYGLKIEWNKAEFEELDTLSKLQTAGSDPAFIEKTGDCLFRHAARADTAAGDRVHPNPLLFGTIVRRLAWAKKPHPTATIDHHSVIVPDFGTVYLGEIFVTSESRRLTMLRAKFGSPTGGFFACSEVDTNGSWHPPTF
jgi:hypothetical protein